MINQYRHMVVLQCGTRYSFVTVHLCCNVLNQFLAIVAIFDLPQGNDLFKRSLNQNGTF